MKCKHCKEEIALDSAPAVGNYYYHTTHGKTFCLTKQGQTIGTLAAPEDDHGDT